MTDFDALAESWTSAVKETAGESDAVHADEKGRGRPRRIQTVEPQSEETGLIPHDEINALCGSLMEAGTSLADVTPYSEDEKARLGNAVYPVYMKYPHMFAAAPELFLAITAVALVAPKVAEYMAKGNTPADPSEPIQTGKLKSL